MPTFFHLHAHEMDMSVSKCVELRVLMVALISLEEDLMIVMHSTRGLWKSDLHNEISDGSKF